MQPFDAVAHALTSIATGGMSTRDASFGEFKGAAEYVATLMMLVASLPFVLYVQFASTFVVLVFLFNEGLSPRRVGAAAGGRGRGSHIAIYSV